MPTEREIMVAQIENETGGRVVTAPPVVTRAGGWRATLSGGELRLVSVTLGPGSTETDALMELASRVVAERERLGITS